MNLLRLIRQESSISLWRLASMAGLSGIMNALLLAIINLAAQDPSNESANFRYMVMFISAISIFITAQFYLLSKSSQLVESCLNSVRLRLLEKIFRSDLLPLEGMGHQKLYYLFSKETVTISQASTTIVIAAQSGLMIMCSIIYLAILSRAAFFLTLVFTTIGVLLHFRMSRDIQIDMREATRREGGFLDVLSELLGGFKEVKLNQDRALDLSAALRTSSESLRDLKIKSSNHFNKHYIFSQCAFYVLLAGLVFLLPHFSETYSEVLRQVTATILFIIGPLTGFIGAIPVVSAANVAVDNIEKVESELTSAEQHHPFAAPTVRRKEFRDIRLENVAFWYGNSPTDGFRLGPLDITIQHGEILFLVGGNGSGKSTLMKLLTSLYYPKEGVIRLDGVKVDDHTYEEYRSLFSVIFTDYHLFNHLYGVHTYETERIADLLQEFQLADKTRLVGDHWQTTDLSTGQRKRLALITSYLDHKPIYVLDEWAADQDPPFRKYFYENILPELKRQGATVIAATHDDRYFHLADRVLKLDFGQLVPYSAETV